MSLHKRKKLYTDVLDEVEDSDHHLWSDILNRHLFAIKQMRKISLLTCFSVSCILLSGIVFLASLCVLLLPPDLLGHFQELTHSIFYLFKVAPNLATISNSTRMILSFSSIFLIILLSIKLTLFFEKIFFNRNEKILLKKYFLKVSAVWIMCLTFLITAQLMINSPLVQFLYQSLPNYTRPLSWFIDWGSAICIVNLVGLYSFYKLI